MSWCDEWNALSDQCRHYMNDEFVDLSGVEKGSDDMGATHHPDVFSFRGTQAPISSLPFSTPERKEAMIWAPPIIQMSFPFAARRRLAKGKDIWMMGGAH